MSLEDLKSEAKTLCQFLVCSEAEVFGIAPGRVEILGNHTDYNDGYVLSAAIDRYTVVGGRKSPTGGRFVSVYSDFYERLLQFKVDTCVKDGTAPWLDYIMGVVDEGIKAGFDIGGFEAAIISDVPAGAGLSSSASLEVAVLYLIKGIFGLEISDADAARICQKAENNFVGMGCGLLDQWSSVHGKEDSLIFLDCRKHESSTIPFGDGVEMVIANTKAEHQLMDGAYNALREGCFRAANCLKEFKPELTHLRDISWEEFQGLEEKVPEDVRTLARHVVSENDRVLRGVEALKAGDLSAFGKLMNESHASSRDNFGNSCPELDAMVECAAGLDGCYGSRLSGGGFGGCTINLVEADKAEEFSNLLTVAYRDKTGIDPEMHICRASNGACTEMA